MAIQLPGLDVLPAGPIRDFVVALHTIYDAAGQPGARTISQDIFRDRSLERVSHETVISTLRGVAVPGWPKVEAIVRQLVRLSASIRRFDESAEVQRIHELWLGARRTTPPPVDVSAPHQRTAPAGSGANLETVTAQTGAGAIGSRPGGEGRGLDGGNPTSGVLPESGPRGRSRDAGAAQRIMGDVPPPHPRFTGRDDLMAEIDLALSTPPAVPVVLFGLGGSGKTQLVAEYAHRRADRYDLVWWIPADRVDRAATALVALAGRLRLPPRQDMRQNIAAVLNELETGSLRWLLIVDNAEDEEVRRLLPSIGGHTVMTTRDAAWAFDLKSIELRGLDEAESIQFLRRSDATMTGPEARRVADRLGGLPLALEQAIALRDATSMSWTDLLASFDDRTADRAVGSGPEAGAAMTSAVAAPLRMAVERLRDVSPAATQLLELFAHLGSEPVPLALLRSGRDGAVSEPLVRALREPIQIGRAIRELGRFGLARVDPEAQRIEVHPLVRVALRGIFDDAAWNRGRRNVHEILAAASPGDADDRGSWVLHGTIAPHVLPANLLDCDSDAPRRVVLDQIRYRYLIGDHEGACQLGERAVAVWSLENGSGGLGPEHELVLMATREWANALRASGQYERSRVLTAEALRILRNSDAYGEAHPHTLMVAISYAHDLRINGRYREALQEDRANLAHHRDRYGELSPKTLAIENNVGVSLRMTGDFAHAWEVDQHVLDVCRELSPQPDRMTLLAISNLARDLCGLGRYQEALDLQQAHLNAYRSLAGPADLSVLLAERTVAVALRRLGRTAEALATAEKTYHNCQASAGSDNECTLAAAITYANALREQGRAVEAMNYATDAAATYRRKFGRSNPLTLAAEVNLAVILRALGELRQAREMDETALEMLTEVVGPEHPHTICAAMNLATDLALAGDAAAARDRSEHTYDTACLVRGTEHPQTLKCAGNLAIDRFATSDAKGGQWLLDHTLSTLRIVLGPGHPVVVEVASGSRTESDIEPPPT